MNAPAASSTLSNNTIYWLCQIGGWGSYCAFQFWTSVATMSWPVDIALAVDAEYMVLLIVATHSLRLYSKRFRWSYLGARALVPRVLLASFVWAAMLVIVGVAIALLLRPLGIDIRIPGQSRFFAVGNAFFNTQLLLLVWMALYLGFSILRQRQEANAIEARLRASLRTAELNLLKSQLNPHFLFNALNTVRALIMESPERAQLAVTQLARTLRYALNSSRDELVTLKNELAIVDDYLGIETLRLAERLTITKSISDNTLTAQIPIMLLQTLVENAVKHGISQMPQGGVLAIAARMDAATLVIEVQNDRPLIKSGSIPSDRVGLANASERLRLMIGSAASLKLDLDRPQHATAIVRIPQTEMGK